MFPIFVYDRPGKRTVLVRGQKLGEFFTTNHITAAYNNIEAGWMLRREHLTDLHAQAEEAGSRVVVSFKPPPKPKRNK